MVLLVNDFERCDHAAVISFSNTAMSRSHPVESRDRKTHYYINVTGHKH